MHGGAAYTLAVGVPSFMGAATWLYKAELCQVEARSTFTADYDDVTHIASDTDIAAQHWIAGATGT